MFIILECEYIRLAPLLSAQVMKIHTGYQNASSSARITLLHAHQTCIQHEELKTKTQSQKIILSNHTQISQTPLREQSKKIKCWKTSLLRNSSMLRFKNHLRQSVCQIEQLNLGIQISIIHQFHNFLWMEIHKNTWNLTLFEAPQSFAVMTFEKHTQFSNPCICQVYVIIMAIRCYCRREIRF